MKPQKNENNNNNNKKHTIENPAPDLPPDVDHLLHFDNDSR